MVSQLPPATGKRFPCIHGNVALLTLARLVGNFGRRMAFGYASLFLTPLGCDPYQISQVNALMALGLLVLLPMARYITDRADRGRLRALAPLLGDLAHLLYVLAPRWKFLAVGTILAGVMTPSTAPESALLTDFLSLEVRGKGMALPSGFVFTTRSQCSGRPVHLVSAIDGLFWLALGLSALYGCHYAEAEV